MAARRNADGTYEVPGHPGTYGTPEEAEAAAARRAGTDTLGPNPTMGYAAPPANAYPVTLPQSDEAKAALRGLQLSGVRGLEALLGLDPSAERQKIEDALYEDQAADINYNLDRQQQAGLETLFGRNVGNSSITGDYVLGPIARERANALASARRNAIARSGEEVRANTTNQLQMLGQAFNSGSQGLQGEANVEQATANRQTQVSEAGAARGQQESQFQRSLNQQRDLQEKGFENAREIASNAAIGAGIGGGLSGLAGLFGPAINQSLFGRADQFGNRSGGLFG